MHLIVHTEVEYYIYTKKCRKGSKALQLWPIYISNKYEPSHYYKIFIKLFFMVKSHISNSSSFHLIPRIDSLLNEWKYQYQHFWEMWKYILWFNILNIFYVNKLFALKCIKIKKHTHNDFYTKESYFFGYILYYTIERVALTA